MDYILLILSLQVSWPISSGIGPFRSLPFRSIVHVFPWQSCKQSQDMVLPPPVENVTMSTLYLPPAQITQIVSKGLSDIVATGQREEANQEQENELNMWKNALKY